LKNAVERALIMAPGDQIDAADLRDLVPNTPASFAAPNPRPSDMTPPASHAGATDEQNSVAPDEDEDPRAASEARRGEPAPRPTTLREFKEQAEREFLVEKLREHHWNISRTAEVIGTPRSNLYKKLEQYSISQDVDG
jgi:two-component system nitrogen regulation response regulator NtrX